MPEQPRVLDCRVDPLTVPQLNALVDETIARGEQRVFGSLNLHGLYLYHRDAKLRDFYSSSDVVRIDGMSVVLLGRLLGLPLRREHRVGYVDWVYPFLSLAEQKGWRVFYLGSRPDVVERGAARLRAMYPRLMLEVHHGYFDPRSDAAENLSVVQRINAFRPHVLIVGLGMPRQQHWILDNRDGISANVISNSGAMMDFVAGAIPTPPRWLGPLGLEWAFRLLSEPRRLGRRYLVEPWFVVRLLLAEYARRARPHRGDALSGHRGASGELASSADGWRWSR